MATLENSTGSLCQSLFRLVEVHEKLHRVDVNDSPGANLDDVEPCSVAVLFTQL